MMRRPAIVRTVIAVVLLLPGGAAAQTTVLEFHSAFWMNLHHYLHALTRADAPLVEELPPAASAVEQKQWASALAFYRSRFAKRSLLFDEWLLDIKQQVTGASDTADLADTTIAPEVRQVLERAAPIYRKLRWPEHDAANKKFITAVRQLIERHGEAIASRLARSYTDGWPPQGFRVDVVRDAGPPGNAYTTNVPRPTHITVGAEYLGLPTLELVFHESSHHWDQQLMKAVNDAARMLDMKPPPNLWHALLFFNAGQITADALAAAGIPDYQMMMIEGKIFARPGWHEAIAAQWPAFLSGTISRDEAIIRILRVLKVP
jgi:hypothetical protein